LGHIWFDQIKSLLPEWQQVKGSFFSCFLNYKMQAQVIKYFDVAGAGHYLKTNQNNRMVAKSLLLLLVYFFIFELRKTKGLNLRPKKNPSPNSYMVLPIFILSYFNG